MGALALNSILIVDDEIHLLKSFKRVLEGAYMLKVRIAPSIEKMLEQCRLEEPSLIILDGMIAHETGTDAMLALYKEVILSEVVTFSSTEEQVVGMLRLGAVGSLPKPFQLSDFEALMAELGYGLIPRRRHEP